MCHRANTHGTQPYVALNNLRVVAGDGGGYSAEREPSPDLSQSSHSVCYACRQPRFLRRLTQLLCTHLSVFLISKSGSRRRRRALVQHPTALPTSSFFPLWSIWSHLLRADVYARCNSASFWVTMPTPRCSHFCD